jgi:hypothetical protein
MALGSGIRDPGSEIRKKPIPDPGVKKAPDPGSESATLVGINLFVEFFKICSPHLLYSSVFFIKGTHTQMDRSRSEFVSRLVCLIFRCPCEFTDPLTYFFW